MVVGADEAGTAGGCTLTPSYWLKLWIIQFILFGVGAVIGRLNGMLGNIAAQCLYVVYFRNLDAILPASRSMIPLAVPIVLGRFCARVVYRQELTPWIGLV